MTHVFYHANCYDGFCAAWVMYQIFGDEAQYHPVQYNCPVPDVEGDVLYIVDFSYPEEILDNLAERFKKVHIFDHHKTAQETLKDYEGAYIVFDMERSGAQITRDEMLPNFDSWLIDYTADRDLWKWEMPQSRTINAGLRTFDFDFHEWNRLTSNIPEALEAGKVLERYCAKLIKGAISHAVEYELPNGEKIRGVNCTMPDIISDVAGGIAEEDGMGMTFFINEEGHYVYSLRSRSDIDVGNLAKMFGGGGHAKAAGFTLPYLLGHDPVKKTARLLEELNDSVWSDANPEAASRLYDLEKEILDWIG